jgi:hypothetical protein
VDGAGELIGGSVTFEPGDIPAAATVVRIERRTAPKQTVDLGDVTRTPGDTLEQQLDRLAMVSQDQGRRRLRVHRTGRGQGHTRAGREAAHLQASQSVARATD